MEQMSDELRQIQQFVSSIHHREKKGPQRSAIVCKCAKPFVYMQRRLQICKANQDVNVALVTLWWGQRA